RRPLDQTGQRIRVGGRVNDRRFNTDAHGVHSFPLGRRSFGPASARWLHPILVCHQSKNLLKIPINVMLILDSGASGVNRLMNGMKIQRN
ncbi:MAG TPA: hypothetical protein VGL59_13340, partial [Polyangia bacterium]